MVVKNHKLTDILWYGWSRAKACQVKGPASELVVTRVCCAHFCNRQWNMNRRFGVHHAGPQIRVRN